MSLIFNYAHGHKILTETPAHVLAEIRGERPREESAAMDFGSAFHGVLLEGDRSAAVIEAPDWRTKAAREARDAARAEGRTPILAHRWAEVQAMVEAARRQLAAFTDPPGLLAEEGGIVEHSLFVELDGVPCRATPDWLSLDHSVCVDLKTTEGSAHPASFAKTLWDKGYAIQAGLYRRVVKATYGVLPDWYWVVIETDAPYALSVVSLDPEALEFADHQVREALRLWQRCVTTNDWPAYPTRPAYAEVPPWVRSAWELRSYYAEEVLR